ncbi:MAG: VOC family protein [Pseudomonadota bacterium]
MPRPLFHRIASAFVSALLLGSLWACDDTASAPPTIPNIKRPNLVVADIERSLTVYRDILGLEASPIRTGAKDSFSYPVFNVPAEADLRFISFHEPGEERVFNLTEVTGIDLPAVPSAPYLSTFLIGITDFYVNFALLDALWFNTTRSQIADGADFKFIEQAFIDPDGHLIVCYEVLAPER